MGLSTDDKVSVRDLLYGLLMVSGNDAAVALAEFVSGNIDDFAILMNEKVLNLGLTSSHFVTPPGLDNDEHYTTAFELAKIADYALCNDVFSKIVRTSNYTVTIDGNPKNLHNTNELLGNLDGVYGVKTGFTNGANRCLVTSCKRGNLDIVCVVLGCDTKKDRTLDSAKLINYVFSNFSVVNVYDIIKSKFDIWVSTQSKNVSIEKCTNSISNFVLDESQIQFKNIAVNNSNLNNINVSIDFTNDFIAPLPKNSIIGKMTVNINDFDYFSVDILNEHTINRKNVFDYLNSFFVNYLGYFDL